MFRLHREKCAPGPYSKFGASASPEFFFFQNYLENHFLYVFGVSKHDYGIILEFRVQFTPLIIKKLYFLPFLEFDEPFFK